MICLISAKNVWLEMLLGDDLSMASEDLHAKILSISKGAWNNKDESTSLYKNMKVHFLFLDSISALLDGEFW